MWTQRRSPEPLLPLASRSAYLIFRFSSAATVAQDPFPSVVTSPRLLSAAILSLLLRGPAGEFVDALVDLAIRAVGAGGGPQRGGAVLVLTISMTFAVTLAVTVRLGLV